MDNKRQSAVWAVRNLGFIKQRIGRKGAQCVLCPAVTVICPSVVYNNIRLIGISAAEERPRDIRQHGWWHVPVPGKPCAGQRLFISGRRKVNARTRRGGERPALRRNRNPIASGLPWAARRTDGRTGGIGGDRSAHRAIAWSMPLVSDIDQRSWPVIGLRSHRRRADDRRGQDDLPYRLPVGELRERKRQRRRRSCSAPSSYASFVGSSQFYRSLLLWRPYVGKPFCFASVFLTPTL